jgi:hypothetical protein
LHPFCGKRMIVRFVLLSESMYIYRHVYTKWLSGYRCLPKFRTKFGKQPPSDIPLEGGMQSFKRQGACVFRNWIYQSESPLKPLPVTWYEQFGTNWIIVLMFVESQRVHIWSTCKYIKKFGCWTII